jgi:hypothetical protein
VLLVVGRPSKRVAALELDAQSARRVAFHQRQSLCPSLRPGLPCCPRLWIRSTYVFSPMRLLRHLWSLTWPSPGRSAQAVPPPTPPRDFRTPFTPLASDGEPVGLTTGESYPAPSAVRIWRADLDFARCCQRSSWLGRTSSASGE